MVGHDGAFPIYETGGAEGAGKGGAVDTMAGAGITTATVGVPEMVSGFTALDIDPAAEDAETRSIGEVAVIIVGLEHPAALGARIGVFISNRELRDDNSAMIVSLS